MSELCCADVDYVNGAECQCSGGKNKSDIYIDDLTKCAHFCCAAYGEADAFLFTSENKDIYKGECSVMRHRLHDLGHTITYKLKSTSFFMRPSYYK